MPSHRVARYSYCCFRHFTTFYVTDNSGDTSMILSTSYSDNVMLATEGGIILLGSQGAVRVVLYC